MQNNSLALRPIAKVHTDFSSKFGIPRQSNIVEELKGTIVFETEFRNPDAVRGLEDFDYIWLLWEFTETKRENWKATVNPPKLDKNVKLGVFATRSPYRPNPIGLSSVKLECIEYTEELGPVIHILGADILDGTPIYDIKPYIPYADAHPEASHGFAGEYVGKELEVIFPEVLLEEIPEEKREALFGVLRQDPRPSYMKYPKRRYGVEFAGYDVRFHVNENVLTVCEIEKL